MDEVEIYVGPDRERFGETRFGLARSAPRIWSGEMLGPPPPVALLSMDDLVEAIRPGGAVWRGARHTISRAGFLRVECVNGTWVYELFPARWSDGEGGPLYVAVWPD